MMFLLKPSWWIQMIVSTFVTMMFIYLIKKITKAVEVDINEAISQFRDLKSYLEDWDEGKY